jgi:hypothetical protein
MCFSAKLWQGLLLSSALGLFFSGSAVAEEMPARADAQAQTTTTPGSAAAKTTDDDWHVNTNVYLWFAGMHGTVGAKGFDASVHASASDVLSKFNIGFMDATEFQKKRFVIPLDIMWVKLSDDKAIPFLPNYAVKAKVTQTIFTPKVGYVLLDHEKLNIQGNVGIRYWHLGTTLELSPQITGRNLYSASNWVDVIAGSRITVPLSPKAFVTILGDAGAGGANLDYQVAGLISYKIKPKWQLFGGWRYLDVDYQTSSAVNDVVQSGLLLGVTYVFK